MGLRVALVNHVENRRHLRDSGRDRRCVLHVVQKLDPGPSSRCWKQSLLGEDTPRAAAGAHRKTDEFDVGRPWLFRERGPCLTACEHDQAEVRARLEQRRNESPRVHFTATGFAGTRWSRLRPTRTPSGGYRLQGRAQQRSRARAALDCCAEPLRSRVTERGPGSVHAQNRIPELLRLG